MALHRQTLKRMDVQAQDVIGRFSDSVDYFETTMPFTGPSLYFHRKTVRLLRAHASAESAVGDVAFLESLYATLASWGMHRMGPGGAKLVDFAEMAESLQEAGRRIGELQRLVIYGVSEHELSGVSHAIWRIVDSLHVSASETVTVAGTKALHHILPDLVPPFDRQHTLRLFLGRTNFGTVGENEVFREILHRLHQIAVACRPQIDELVDATKWSTSVSKVVDNAIVGYAKMHLG